MIGTLTLSRVEVTDNHATYDTVICSNTPLNNQCGGPLSGTWRWSCTGPSSHQLAYILRGFPQLVSWLTPRKLVTRMRPLPNAHPGLLRRSRFSRDVARSRRGLTLPGNGLVKHSDCAAAGRCDVVCASRFALQRPPFLHTGHQVCNSQ